MKLVYPTFAQLHIILNRHHTYIVQIYSKVIQRYVLIIQSIQLYNLRSYTAAVSKIQYQLFCVIII
jgi:hypothetical protein